jgi:hypothetical protein
MATRMQQRRGTAAQWTAANPVLAAGEIGFETDTNKFKMGNGTSAWASLAYFANATELAAAIDAVVGIAPETLDTLAEIAASLGDDPDFLSDLATNARLDSTIVSQAAALTDAITFGSSALSTHTANTQNVHGIANTSALALKSEVADAKSEAIVAAAADATTKAADAKSEAITEANTAIGTAVSAITPASLGLGSVDNTSDLSKPVSSAQEYAIAAAKTEAITDAATAADDKISAHNLDETNVHGIADTSVLVTQTDLTNAINGVTVDQSALAGAGLAWDGVAEQFTVDTTIATKTYADGGVSTHNDATTLVHGISDTAHLVYDTGATFTGDVTIETNLTIDGDLTVTGTTTTVNATDLVVSDPLIYLGEGNSGNLADLGFVANFNDGTYQHAGLVRDSSAGTWKLFKGVTDEPTTTVNFAQGSLDSLAVGELTATTITPSSGIVFSDGTQTKQGVPSLTTIIQKTDSYTLSSLSERDSMIEFSGQSGMTVTIPSDSSLNFPVGTSLDVLQTASGQVTIAGAQGVTVAATPGLKLRTQWSSATLVKRAANTWVVMGDLTA